MKPKNLNIIKYFFLAALLVMLVFAGCKEDEPVGFPPTANLQTLIDEAENLVATSKEGTSPGDFQPGSIKQLQEVITWVDWQINNATEQGEIDKAAIRLQKYIEIFKTSTVKLAIPIFNNTPQSWIQISDNIKPLFSNSFTLEFETYYLGPTGWLQNIISMEDDPGGPTGFTVRYWSGNLDLVVGDGSGWPNASAAGAFKVGEWVHYAVTSNGTTWKVYMNGVEIITLAAPGMKLGAKPLVIGNGPNWTDRAYNGMIKDFRVWSTVKDVAQLYANKDVQLEGNEPELKVYFPLDADLGKEFKDNSGNYTAKFVGTGITWAPGGIPPVIVIDFTALDAAIASAEAYKASVVEGTEDGKHPKGTKEYLQSLINQAKATLETAEKQEQADAAVKTINDAIKLVGKNLVADAMGVYVDRDKASAVGLRITPNYTPQGDYTVEFDLKLKTLKMGGSGEIFGNGSFGLRVFGYTELTEEEMLNAGGLWNFTNANNAWEGPTAPQLTMKSGIWQHVAIVHDDAAKTTTIFVDGVQVGKQENLGHPLKSDWGEIWLGNSWGQKMNGTIKDFRIWDEVRTELNADITGSEANLQVYFPLDRVAGLLFSDVTGKYKAEMRGIEWEK
jgi:hypothetical protein